MLSPFVGFIFFGEKAMIYLQYISGFSLVRKLCLVMLSSFILCTAQAAEPPKIIRFWLVDAETDTRITAIPVLFHVNLLI